MGYFVLNGAVRFLVPTRRAVRYTQVTIGQEYLDCSEKLAPQFRYITNKMLGNYQQLGLIQLILP